ADGRMRVEMLFEGEQHACEQVLSFGARAEVIEPASLRTLVHATALRIAEQYAAPVAALA
ncbi:hypothetical protein SE17_37765, partial [Kouleothrix aurantiaca]